MSSLLSRCDCLSCQRTHSRVIRIMSGADIDKWLNGETETFFNPRETPSASAGSNPRDENAPVQSLLWRFTPSATIISVAALGTATAVSLFILTRFSPDTISRHTTIPVITLHNPKSSPVAYAPLPPRETVTRPTPPEPQSEVKREDGLPTTLRPATHAAEVHGSGDALRAPLSSNLPMGDRSADPLSSNSGARAATPTASPLTERANAFINSYWQTIGERSDQVLPYLSSSIRSRCKLLWQVDS